MAYFPTRDFDHAVEDLAEAIELNPDYADAYANRGAVYLLAGDFDHAIEDLTKAVELNPNDAIAYNNRGMVWLYLREWENAKSDLTTAKNIGLNIINVFHNNYENVPDFESKHGIQLPEDITAMLKRPQN